MYVHINLYGCTQTYLYYICYTKLRKNTFYRLEAFIYIDYFAQIHPEFWRLYARETHVFLAEPSDQMERSKAIP